MSKELTEKWREGRLPDGAYYILVDKYEQNEPEIDVGICCDSNFEWWIVKEVLASVPSYEDFQRLQEQLKEANEVLLPLKYKPSYTRGINLYDVHRYLDKWGVK